MTGKAAAFHQSAVVAFEGRRFKDYRSLTYVTLCNDDFTLTCMLKRASGLVDSLRVGKWPAEWLLVRSVFNLVAFGLLAFFESAEMVKLVPNFAPRSAVKFVVKLSRLW